MAGRLWSITYKTNALDIDTRTELFDVNPTAPTTTLYGHRAAEMELTKLLCGKDKVDENRDFGLPTEDNKREPGVQQPTEESKSISTQSVIVEFQSESQDIEQFYELEDELEDAFASNDIGKYDGHELETDRIAGKLYIYGPDANVLFSTVKPLLEKASFMSGALVTQRFGNADDDNANEITTVIELPSAAT